MNRELAARKLSAALGRKVAVEEITDLCPDLFSQKHTYVALGDKGYFLQGGNTAYIPGEYIYMRNGREVEDPD